MSNIKNELITDFLTFSSAANKRSTVDVRDGLKPVQRRILSVLSDVPKNKLTKSNKIVGDVMGKYHPHGDTSIYDAMIRMHQPHKTRYPLVYVDGNAGSVTEPAAAMRYTEAQLTDLGLFVTQGLKKDTVDYIESATGEGYEPEYMPGLLPIALMNGTIGIGVGMASSIPPHNLRELSKGIGALIENPEIDTAGLMRYIKGPDFPTGGTIGNPEALLEVYETGRGSVRVKGDYEVKTIDGYPVIMIKNIPYNVDPQKNIAGPIHQMYAEGYEYIDDVKEHTGKGKPFEYHIKLTKDAPVFAVLEKILKETLIESTFTINLTTHLGENKYQRKGLKELLNRYISQNLETNRRSNEFDRRKLVSRKLIIEGLIKAQASIEEVIKIIRESDNTSDAQDRLEKFLDIVEEQSKAILAMRLSQLTKLDVNKLKNELTEVISKIAVIDAFLSDKDAQLEKVKTDLATIANRFGDDRRTKITETAEVGEKQDITVFLTSNNEIYAQPTSCLEINNRNTKGKKHEEDIIDALQTTNASKLWIVSDDGYVSVIDAASLMVSETIVKNGTFNFGVRSGAKAVQLVNPAYAENIVTVTDGGIVKRSATKDYRSDRNFKACKVREGDKLSKLYLIESDEKLLIILDTKQYVWFSVNEINQTGTNTIGTKLGSRDVISIARESDKLLFVSEDGNGKLIEKGKLKESGRKTTGLACNDTVAVREVRDNTYAYFADSTGRTIRIHNSKISTVQSPTAKGVILYNGKIDKILTD